MKAQCPEGVAGIFPEWDDDDTRRKAGREDGGWLVSYGIPGEVLDNRSTTPR